MTENSMPDALRRMAEAGRISAEDVLTMRRQVFTDGVVQPREADWLFALNDACEDTAPEWPVFFIEALVDYTVHQAEPHGYMSEENAQWLIDRVSRDGKVKTRTELELLLKVLEQSRISPESLVRFALSQVKMAVLDGKGPVRSGAVLEPGRIGKAEVEVLRRVVFAYGGAENIAVTRTEAEILFDINDATRDGEIDPEWADFFVKAIANHLLAGHAHEIPSREVALARAKWLDEPSKGFFSAMTAGLTGIWQAFRQPDAWEERAERQEEAIRAAERVSSEEARWLAAKLERYKQMRDHEVALVQFVTEESTDVDPALRPLMDKVRVGALGGGGITVPH